MAKVRVTNLHPHERRAVREAVALAMRYWPNAHLGDQTPREDMRSAFSTIRSYVNAGDDLMVGVHAVESDAYAHMDM